MKRAAFVLFSEPFLFPPTLHAAEILAADGWKVDILGMRIPRVRRWQLGDNITIHDFGELRKGLSLRLQYLRFILWVRRMAEKARFRAVFGYDMMAGLPAAIAARACGALLVYHNHDLMMPQETRWLFYRLVKRGEEAAARAAGMVVFPQKERGRIFSRQAKLKRSPAIVYNCPLLSWPETAELQAPEVTAWKETVGNIILYQGGLLEHRGLFRLVDSMRDWTFEGGLLMVGLPLEENIVERLKERARAGGLLHRVMILPPIDHNNLASLSRLADVGIGVLQSGKAAGNDPRYVNLRHLGGASNKIFEYMAAGLPVICARGSGFEEIIREPEHGFLCDGHSAEDIARAINDVFAEPQRYHSISQANQTAFREKYNYEAQFRPVLDFIDSGSV